MEATKVKERPILFSAQMVRAILEGRKTQTRRVVKPQPNFVGMEKGIWDPNRVHLLRAKQAGGKIECPHGSAGDLLWVRESAWYDHPPMLDIGRRCFYVDGKVKMERTGDYGWSVGGEVQSKAGHLEELYRLNGSLTKKPSIFMPRWASRITLEIQKVRVERLQDITEADAYAEGIAGTLPEDAVDDVVEEYAALWDDLNGPRGFGWRKNPWVWVIEFRSRRTHSGGFY